MQSILAATPQVVREAQPHLAGTEKTALQQRYQRAREYLDWFEPAWCQLNTSEQLVLREFYMRDTLRSGANARLQVKLGYSERNVDRIRSRALGKLARLLYGSA